MKTVLICDDVQTDRDLMGKIVADSGCKAEYAVDGSEAIEKAKELQPALILLDVVMPKTDGFSACRAIKKDPATLEIPVILVTTKGTEADKFWGQKQGADGHIAKPFTPDELTAVVKQFVDKE